MTKVLAILGSPRRGGNSEALLDAAIEGAQAAGAEVEKIAVEELKFSPCLAYRDCSRSKGVCVLEDDLTPLYPKLRDADHIILASPVFFLGLPAQLKALVDRCQPFWVIKDELGRSPARPGPPRRGLFLAVCSQNRIWEFQAAIASVKAMFITLDVRYFDEVLVGGVDAPDDVAHHPKALEGAQDAGRRLITGERAGPPLVSSQLGHPKPDIRPVGVVRNAVKEPIHHGWEEIISEIELNPDFIDALDGLEEYSHITVLFWIHKLPPELRRQIKIRPMDREDLPLVGVFATRTQLRPNPVGMTTVRLLRRRKNRLQVQGLDAIDGTPVLDIKPHLPPYDSPEGVRLPEWTLRLREERGSQ